MLLSSWTECRTLRRLPSVRYGFASAHNSSQEEPRRQTARRRNYENVLKRPEADDVTKAAKKKMGLKGFRASNADASLPESRKIMVTKLPPRIGPLTTKHTDLASFLNYASRTSMNPSSSVYKGTRFEYRVAEVLETYDFSLNRVGRSNDRGTDLLGHWTIPGYTNGRSLELPVIVQCKASKPQPSMIRELQGAYAGASAGWRGQDVMALLVASGESTRGVVEALQTTQSPMGFMCITEDGAIKQFLWNQAAARLGLEGLGTAVKYAGSGDAAGVGTSIALTWMGQLWYKPGPARISRPPVRS